MDVLIIGGGPAGMTAALYCARAGLAVTVLEKAVVGGQMALAEEIENYPAAKKAGITLSQAMQEQAEEFGAKFLQAEISSADLQEKMKLLKSASLSFEAPCVIIATGAAPKELGVINEEAYIGRGVSYCAACDGRFFKGKRVAVVGGGNTAVSEALHLSSLCAQVHLLHRRSELRAEAELQNRLNASAVIFHPDTQVCSLLGEERLTGIELIKNGNKEILSVDGLFVAIGRKPESAPFLKSLAADEQGYLLAGEDTKTPLPGVFVAGDVRRKPLRQIITAASDGAIAAQQAVSYLHQIS